MRREGYLVEKKFHLNPTPYIADEITMARQEAKRLCEVFGAACILTDKSGLYFTARIGDNPRKTHFANRIYEIWRPRMVEGE